MKFSYCVSVLGLSAVLLTGCGRIHEAGRMLWGSSTRSLERVRDQAMVRTYACEYFECYDAVLAVAEEQEWLVFSQYEVRGLIVLMHIPMTVDTTEVGVFLSETDPAAVHVEVVSLSTNAKRRAAKALFRGLDQRFVNRSVEVRGVSQ